MTEPQKKNQLEKIYNKIHEGSDNTLTEEGRMLCMQLDINPADLVIHNYEHFKKNDNEPDEVVKIRYEHYKNRRNSK